jgi:hypothetical protein
MHWYHLEAIAAERVRDLQAEAARVRRARKARRPAASWDVGTGNSSNGNIALSAVPALDRPPDTYEEFLIRASGCVQEEPSAVERSQGQPVG